MFDLQKIEEISKGVDEHLRKLESMIGLMREIKNSLDEMRHSQERNYLFELQKLRIELGNIGDQLKNNGIAQSDKYGREIQEIRNILNSEEWPIAVDPESICDTPEKASERAENILDIVIGEHMKNKKFLDYGCGEGHTIQKAQEREALITIGYDVDISKINFEKNNFTNDFSVVKTMAPFDIILLHDVLDHAVIIDPIQILNQVKSVLSPKGKIYIRNHPWTSRHGGHLYTKKNKAFLHLSLDSVELMRIGGLECDVNIKVKNPLETYRYWFEEAGLKIINEYIIREKVEDFFTKPSLINERIKKNFDNEISMINQLEISFVEYILEPKLDEHNLV